MKREIKFRAWCKLTNSMIYDYCVLKNTRFDGYDLTNNQHEIIDVMQYTGLKDKNGKEIYEGDIFKSKYSELYKVIFKNGAFSHKGIHERLNLFYNLSNVNKECEIIGNIHENPELIK